MGRYQEVHHWADASRTNLGCDPRHAGVPLRPRPVSSDTNPQYWSEYSNLQHVKHELIRRYLGGWFAKLGSWAGRVVYFDTHAGRGKHLTGELGSPLVALRTLLDHSSRDRLLKSCDFVFYFFERDEENLDSLRSEIRNLGRLPERVRIWPVGGDCYSELSKVVASLRESRQAMAPAFGFVDPYGFKVPGDLLRSLMTAGRVELFVNIIWRELDMALAQGTSGKMPDVLDAIFGGSEWRSRIQADEFDVRADQAVGLLAEKVSARWRTYIRMLGDNRATRYLLAHFTNHDAGRDLMKECMWAVCPDGGFYVRKSDDPSQQFLITPTPDLTPLRQWVLNALHKRPHRWQELIDALRSEIWREPHLTKVIGALRAEEAVAAEDYRGRFGPSANPLLKIP